MNFERCNTAKVGVCHQCMIYHMDKNFIVVLVESKGDLYEIEPLERWAGIGKSVIIIKSFCSNVMCPYSSEKQI